jgi:NTP pyrophosphatase (non-canonical NTP hydrolase)
MTFETLKIATIVHWTKKGLYKSATNEKQTEKLLEEAQEVKEAFESESEEAQKKEIGDCLTVIINLCQINNFTPEECLQLAYLKNTKRDGKMLDGEFLHDKPTKQG